MTLNENQWKHLLDQITASRCVPFVGAGFAFPALPSGGDFAQQLSDRWGMPLTNSRDLSAVAQHIAVHLPSPRAAKDHFADLAAKAIAPPHYAQLASLPIKLFVTTNYDDLLTKALQAAGKHPRLEVAAWNSYVLTQHRDELCATLDETYDPSPDEPLVFHLHGHYKYPGSMVMSDADYAEFLRAWRARKSWLIPDALHALLQESSWLILGYGLQDAAVRMLLQQHTLGALSRSGQPTGASTSSANAAGHVIVKRATPARKGFTDADALQWELEYNKALWFASTYAGEVSAFVADLATRWSKYVP